MPTECRVIPEATLIDRACDVVGAERQHVLERRQHDGFRPQVAVCVDARDPRQRTTEPLGQRPVEGHGDRSAEQRGLGPRLERLHVRGEPRGLDQRVVVDPQDVRPTRLVHRAIACRGDARRRFDERADGQTAAIALDHLRRVVRARVVDEHHLPRHPGVLQRTETLQRAREHRPAIAGADGDAGDDLRHGRGKGVPGLEPWLHPARWPSEPTERRGSTSG